MSRKLLLRTLLPFALLASAMPAQSQTCEYFLGYISDEAERSYAVKKVYRYTPERIEQILSLRNKGAQLCNSGDTEQGLVVLKEAVKLINFTRLR